MKLCFWNFQYEKDLSRYPIKKKKKKIRVDIVLVLDYYSFRMTFSERLVKLDS